MRSQDCVLKESTADDKPPAARTTAQEQFVAVVSQNDIVEGGNCVLILR